MLNQNHFMLDNQPLREYDKDVSKRLDILFSVRKAEKEKWSQFMTSLQKVKDDMKALKDMERTLVEEIKILKEQPKRTLEQAMRELSNIQAIIASRSGNSAYGLGVSLDSKKNRQSTEPLAKKMYELMSKSEKPSLRINEILNLLQTVGVEANYGRVATILSRYAKKNKYFKYIALGEYKALAN
jgi:hypothetical protein